MEEKDRYVRLFTSLFSPLHRSTRFFMKTPFEIKQILYQHCQEYVLDLIQRAQNGLKEAQAEANREQKSSAGDKFETHRAMMHLQAESFLKRLGVAQDLDRTLHSVSLEFSPKASLGSLVRTEQGSFFIAISAPSLTLDGVEYFCLSVDAPLYKAFHGYQEGDWVEWKTPEGMDDALEILAVD